MQIVQFLKELHDGMLDHAQSLRFDKNHPWHFLLVSLFGSLLELTGCMLTLFENRGKIGLQPLFRTFLETYVEFYNLMRDPRYGYHFDATDLAESIKRLKAARRGNRYMAPISGKNDIPARIDEWESRLTELQSKGYKPLKIRQKFERAGMLELYECLYSIVSAHSHSSKEALIDRHFEFVGDEFELVFYKNPPDERFQYLLGTTAELLEHFSCCCMPPR